MNELKTGQFYGQTNQTVKLGNLTLTDTEYTHDWVDWHFHENAYFTFILDGRVLEGNRKETYHCTAGSLLFHHWQEAHFNSKPKGYTRGFHVEINPDWFKTHDLRTDAVQGSLNLQNPHLKTLMYSIVKETKLYKGDERLAIDALLVKLLSEINPAPEKPYRTQPAWVNQIRTLLHDAPDVAWTLEHLSSYVAIHPVHLCREFPRYFHAHLGDYVRTLRIQKALPLLVSPEIPLTEIALSCGFADQSHFIRSFKAQHSVTPSQYRKLLVRDGSG
ncbi:hypothetical protein GCM10028807_48640 [Spirosoma daeguense]